MSLASISLEFIYVRVPRTASTTFTARLREQFPYELIEVGKQHATSEELKHLWGPLWDTYFTFGLIRNPWEWLVSVYNSGAAIGEWPGDRVLPKDTPGIHPGQRMGLTFDEWVRKGPSQADWLQGVDKVYRMEDVMRGEKKTNAVKHSPYQEWYTPELAEYVGSRYWWEVEKGNYEFGKT